MSLFSGMNDMLENKAVTESSEDMLMFEEELAMEADELIDIMVDKEDIYAMESNGTVGCCEDDIDQMVAEDEEDDEIERELEEEENSIAGASESFMDDLDSSFLDDLLATESFKYDYGFDDIAEESFGDYDDFSEFEFDSDIAEESYDAIDQFFDETGVASESEALTGDSFLKSLHLDNDDPITTKDGSLGPETSAANFPENFAAEFDDNDDPISTYPGSVGQKTSSANFPENFAAEFNDNDDPISTYFGSIGQKTSTAKDPIMESELFFDELLDLDIAEEGFIKNARAKKVQKRNEEAKFIGINDYPESKISELINAKKYKEAQKLCAKFVKQLENKLSKIAEDDPDAKKKRKIANKFIKTNSALLLGIEIDIAKEKYKKTGMSEKEAGRKAKTEVMAKDKSSLSPAAEAMLEDCFEMINAFEASIDPEFTEDGSIGQKDSKATYPDNFSDGELDDFDPVKTNDGSEGQEDSKATYPDNFSDGELDDFDPVKTNDGSVGQEDSTAKDPTLESSLDDELSAMNDILYSSIDDEDDLF